MNKILDILGLVSKKELAKCLESYAYDADAYKRNEDKRLFYMNMGQWQIMSGIISKFNIKWNYKEN